jgi:AsmA protein
LYGYYPQKEQKKAAHPKKKPTPAKKTDYRPLRRLVVNGDLRVGKLKVGNARIQQFHLTLAGRKGIFNLDPIAFQLYQGNVSGKGGMDVRKDTPKSNISLLAKGIQVGPLLKDVLAKDVLEGTTQARIALNMSGDTPEKIKQTLNGNGEFLFKDGAIKGIDLAGMVRNVKATFGLAKKSEAKPKTDFSELYSPFTITNGVVTTTNTRLHSPLLRIGASGKADLNREVLDFRVKPKVVFTLKGQGDAKQRSGVMVPVLISGSFASPKFRPDLKGLLEQQLKQGIPTKLPTKLPDLKKSLVGGGDEKAGAEQVQEKAKGFLKGLPFGR